jgi:dimeric dUTPase (all-alpha-NTP-PPase superfamily)
MIKTYNCDTSFRYIMDSIKNNKRFQYTRFGDGDIYMICNINQYDPEWKSSAVGSVAGKYNQFKVTKELISELRESYNIEDKNYAVASILNQNEINIAVNDNTRLLEKINQNENINIISRNEFYHHFVFIHTFARNFEFFKEEVDKHIKPLRKMYIGDKISENFIKVFGDIEKFVETPSQNSYETIDDWYVKVLKDIDEVDVIFLCSGFSSRVLSKRIWKLNKNVVCLDLGSFISGLEFNFNRFWFSGLENNFKDNMKKYGDVKK